MLLDRSFKTKLNAYIVKNYTELCRDDDQYLMWDAGESLAKDAGLTNNESLDLKSLIDEVGDTFHDKLFQYIDNSGMTDAEIYKKAGLDRKLFSKIRSNPAYHPGKNIVLALAIALELDINKTNDLLSRAEYAFSPSNKGDLIIKFFIESFNRFLIISLDVLICRYSPLFRAFPALFISEEPHKSFYYPLCFRSQK